MESKKDLTGQKFFCWTVIKLSFRIGKRSYWECRCDCGAMQIVQEVNFKNERSWSCNCLKGNGKSKKTKTTYKINILHGMSSWPEYKVWKSLRARCFNKNDKNFKDYGGRGIEVCESWRNSFTNFITDVGRRPSPTHSIDRIDNNGNYEPNNCKWSNSSEQANNRRNNHILTLDGKSLNIMQWAKTTEIPYDEILRRLKEGWPAEQALYAPKVPKVREFKIDNTMIGKRFNKLVVLEFSHRDCKSLKYWKTICDCGKIKVIRQKHLRSGQVKSCGCLRTKGPKESHNIKQAKKEVIVILEQRSKTRLTSRFCQTSKSNKSKSKTKYTRNSYEKNKC